MSLEVDLGGSGSRSSAETSPPGVAECLTQPLGEAANVMNSHSSWYDFCSELIWLSGSGSRIEHKELEAITDGELPNKGLYAETLRYSSERLNQFVGF